MKCHFHSKVEITIFFILVLERQRDINQQNVTLLKQLILIEQNLQKTKLKLRNAHTRKSQGMPISQAELNNQFS